MPKRPARLGHPLTARRACRFVVGTVALDCSRRCCSPASASSGSAEEPCRFYMLLGGGLLGAIYVTVNLVLAPRIGVAALMALGIAGQLFAALLIDRLGLFELIERGLTRRPRQRRPAGAGGSADGAHACSACDVAHRAIRLSSSGGPDRAAPGRSRAIGAAASGRSRRHAAAFADRTILDLPELLAPGDALVFNDTKVIPAELKGVRTRDGSEAQISVTLDRADRRQSLAGFGAAGQAAESLATASCSARAAMSACSAALAATVEASGEEGEVTLDFDFSGAGARRGDRKRSAPCRCRLTSPRAVPPMHGTAPTIRPFRAG